MTTAHTMPSVAKRFFAKVNKNGPVPSHCPELGPCHVWTGAVDDRGYGRFGLRGKNERAHRVAFLLNYGRWPEPQALHHCDNVSCVNGSHLFEGTPKVNAEDRDAKGRWRGAGGVRKGQRPSREGRRPSRAHVGQHGSLTHPERVPRGEYHGRTKLSDADVQTLLSTPGSCSAVGRQFGVTKSYVSQLRRGNFRKAAST